MIVVIDYGLGNLGSISNMLKKIGVQAIVTSQVSDIEAASKLILPGVGAFQAGMQNLRKMGVIPLLEKKVLKDRIPILGICLGAQLLTEASEEGHETGLGWIKGRTVRFQFEASSTLKTPHMGWNDIQIQKAENPLLKDLGPAPRFYFVHSYYMVCDDESSVLAKTHYSHDFASAVHRDNIYGVQFHPEKSHKFGFALFKNFAERC